jgi:hypothetical protein
MPTCKTCRAYDYRPPLSHYVNVKGQLQQTKIAKSGDFHRIELSNSIGARLCKMADALVM